jgi:hypothetical protein
MAGARRLPSVIDRANSRLRGGRPRPVKTMYGTAKNTWAFPPTTPGNFTRTRGGSARSRHLSLGVALQQLRQPGSRHSRVGAPT